SSVLALYTLVSLRLLSLALPPFLLSSFFFFNPPSPTDIYTLSLHDALPISLGVSGTPWAEMDPARPTRSPASPRRPSPPQEPSMPVLPVRRLARGTSVGLGAAALVAASALLPLGTAAAAAEPGDEITLMTFNDFHGALGGASDLACAVETVRAESPTSFLLSAGDSVGGSSF